MRFPRPTCIIAMTLFAVLAIPVRLAAQDEQLRNPEKPPDYKLTVLGTLGGVTSIAQGINNKGQLVGSSDNKQETTFDMFRWQHNVMKDLGHLPGGNETIVFTNPNERGDVSGSSNTSKPDPNGEDFCFFGDHHICLGVLWRNGVRKALPTLGGNNSSAFGVGNRGQVVGVAENSTLDLTCLPFAFYLQAKPVIWQNGTVQELPTIDGDADGWANWMNDRGQIVGYSGLCYVEFPATALHAVLWPDGPNGGVVDLGSLGGSTWNMAFYINNRGQVVGQSGLPGDQAFHAFLWTKDNGMTDLGTLPGDVVSWANDINNKGQAVGTSFDVNSNEHPFIWQNGAMTDLNTLIPPHSPLYLLEAFGINDRGQIAGWGAISNGDHRGFLLTPCDEHHPGVEGCDYRMVDAPAAAPETSPAVRNASSRTLPQSILRRMNRYDFPGPAFDPKN